MAIQPLSIARKPSSIPDRIIQEEPETFSGARIGEQASAAVKTGGALAKGLGEEQASIEKEKQQVISEREKAKAFEIMLQQRDLTLNATVEELEQKAMEDEKFEPLLGKYRDKAAQYSRLLKTAKDDDTSMKLMEQYLTSYSNDMNAVLNLGKKPEKSFEEKLKEAEEMAEATAKGRAKGSPTKSPRERESDKKRKDRIKDARDNLEIYERDYLNALTRHGVKVGADKRVEFENVASFDKEAAQKEIRSLLKKYNDARSALGKKKVGLYEQPLPEREEQTSSSATLSKTQRASNLITTLEEALKQETDPNMKKRIQDKIDELKSLI